MNYLNFVVDSREKVPGFYHHLRVALNREREVITEAVQRRRFWYVDIPRTGSSSLQLMIGKTYGFPFGKDETEGTVENSQSVRSTLLPPHTPAFIAKEIIGPELWDQSKIFSIIRHPLQWAVSLWQYSIVYGNFARGDGSLRAFLDDLAHQTAKPLHERKFWPTSYLQSDYLFCPFTGHRLVSEVLRYEDWPGVAAWVKEHLDVTLDDGVRLYPTSATSIEVDAQDEAYAREILRRDYELLGYS